MTHDRPTWRVDGRATEPGAAGGFSRSAWQACGMVMRPMFPLESVLLPGMVLPLHVFEERYRTLVRDCMDGEREFGVVMIERGSEVGGGDARSQVGTVAQILQAEENDDGRWAMVAVGVRRIRVEKWHDDDPYPRAEVVDWADETDETGGSNGDHAADLAEMYRQQVSQLRRVLAMTAELGHEADPTVEVAQDPLVGSYHLAALAPIGPLDRQRLLAAAGPRDRLVRLAALLAEVSTDLEAQLGGA